VSGHAFVRPGQVAPHLLPPDNCMVCGHPEAAHVSAELAARRTAAAAVADDFKRETDAYIDAGGPRPDFGSWAWRLHTELRLVLDRLDAGEPGPLEHLGQRGILRQALTDAIAYRDPSGICPDCDAHPAGLCSDHAEDLDKTDAYLELARSLGIEVDR
jgi:hypothetical protein